MEMSKGMRDSLRKYINVENAIDICITATNSNIHFLCFATDNHGQALKDYWLQETESGTKVKEISYSQGNRVKQYSVLLNKIPQDVCKISFLICSKGRLREQSLPTMAVRQNNSTALSLSTDKFVNGDETATITLPDLNHMKNQLKDASQFWLISGSYLSFTGTYVNLIKEYFEQGHGIYIWGDNDPWYADANSVISNLFHIRMYGNSPGDQVVSLSGNNNKKSGIIRNHLISTGVVNIYEGITVAEIETDDYIKPLIYGSNERVITAVYDHAGKRALIDGGFTRLYEKWDSAGTDRYIVNAAAWLVNSERFRDKIKINKKVI
jgi:hypothetical protein